MAREVQSLLIGREGIFSCKSNPFRNRLPQIFDINVFCNHESFFDKLKNAFVKHLPFLLLIYRESKTIFCSFLFGGCFSNTLCRIILF